MKRVGITSLMCVTVCWCLGNSTAFSQSQPPTVKSVNQSDNSTAPPSSLLNGNVPAAPKVVAPGTPEPDGKVPKVENVKEVQTPAPPADAPPDSKPVLSAPAPSPEVLEVLPRIRYFVLVYSSESRPKRGKYTHTWATFVKATPKPKYSGAYDPQGEQAQYYDLTAHTISWMPASLKLRVLKLRPDVGRNFSNDETMRYVLGNGECIALWGPYELNPTIAEEVYEKAIKQIARLNSGCILYKAIDPDSGPNAGRIIDCIHAVSDLDGLSRRLRYNEFQNFGWDGGLVIVRSLVNANRLDPNLRHEWIAAALGVNHYCVSRQSFQNCRPHAMAVESN